MANLLEIAHDPALESIERQEKRIDELRQRGSTLLAAAAIAASVLGAQAARSHTIGVVSGLAIVAFVVAVLAILCVIWPHRLMLEIRGSWLLHAFRNRGVSVDETLEASIGWIDALQARNQPLLDRLSAAYGPRASPSAWRSCCGRPASRVASREDAPALGRIRR